MIRIDVKRVWTSSLINAFRAPYDAYIDNKYLGIIFLDPISLSIYEESKVFLSKLGYGDEVEIKIKEDLPTRTGLDTLIPPSL